MLAPHLIFSVKHHNSSVGYGSLKQNNIVVSYFEGGIMAQTKIFLSYSWDDDTHRAWVQKLADELDAYHELHVILDSYDLDSSNDKNFFMEKGLGDADFIIIVATKEYKRKADQREGGVGIETYLATAKHWKGMLEGKATKLVVVRRDKDAVPAYMDGHFYVDFSEEIDYLSSFDKLISHIKGGG
ncbi:toll/interleukin-1 receptor domain-containing protein [Achromobacter xylosoxidans]|uniref:toll/interleukin-1 receptor domain-containing protein n=1 Tax=Alcaligenes xylosoxydans xylosoxydans TaxID=85698 RepID=UPI001F13A336|nr:toll/interleukin-1 receptor domain-containing protein [Achromobacter xylosoxidans]